MPGFPKFTEFTKFLAFGSGVGIQINGNNLEVTLARVRPAGIDVSGSLTISDFASRPAAEWGAEYSRFVRGHGASHLAATVLLPRHEVIVRTIALPGVAAHDLGSAISLQLDSLHPYGDAEVVYGWSRLANGGVLIGILPRSTLERHIALFNEAGVPVGCFTFSAAAIHAAHRIPVGNAEPRIEFVATAAGENGTSEVYGESAAKPVFSAEFDLPPERAALVAISELRLEPGTSPVSLDRILPPPRNNPVTNDLGRRALPYATALAGACPWLTPAANLLPAEHRRSSSRAMYVPTAVLGLVLLMLGGALVAHSAIEDRRYLRKLAGEIARLEPQARRASMLDREIARAQGRMRLLEGVRKYTKADLDALNELTALLKPPTWTSTIDLTRDAVTISGETDQAAPLLKVIDSSRYFQNSAFVGSLAKAGGNEQFQIRAAREAN